VTAKARWRSEAERILQLPPEEFAKWMKGKTEAQFTKLETDWSFWERDDQRPPAGDWQIWLLMAGRGYGKTRVGAEWIRRFAEANDDAHIAIIGSTLGEARSIMVEGVSGLLSIAPDLTRPVWEPSRRLLTWPGGAIGHVYSAIESESLRGPEHDVAWADEVAKWDNAKATWDNLMMTLRRGATPRVVATTTPRPVPLVRQLLNGQDTVVTRGKMDDNELNVSKTWIATMRNLYGGTRLGRQELDGDLIDDVEGALWSRDLIERCRIGVAPALRRIVIGVDPPAGIGGDACGIVVVGLGVDDRAYVLADCSVSGRSPEGWARVVAQSYEAWAADRIIVEGNQGGAMVESVLRAASLNMPLKRVFASVGKVTRAEPVFALYESGRIWHVGRFDGIEDELCGLIIGGDYQGPGRSPDRADALVWAVSELMLGKVGVPRVRRM
jgi:phage terminase large subunit-like protein